MAGLPGGLTTNDNTPGLKVLLSVVYISVYSVLSVNQRLKPNLHI